MTRVILSEQSEPKDLLAEQKIASIDSAKIPRLHFIPLGMTRFWGLGENVGGGAYDAPFAVAAVFRDVQGAVPYKAFEGYA